jgi:hypothetical protein
LDDLDERKKKRDQVVPLMRDPWNVSQKERKKRVEEMDSNNI